MRIALYQPDIPQNTGTLLRLGACLGIGVDIIEPCGFSFSDKALKRSGMDYLDLVSCRRHICFEEFLAYKKEHGSEYGRIVLLTTKALVSYADFEFRENDILLLGRESAGVPEAVHAMAEEKIIIPMVNGVRSLNVAISAAMVLGKVMAK